MEQLFSEVVLSYKTVFEPYRKRREQVRYQARKKAKTTNSLYLSDRQGLMLAMSQPISGEHHDLYNIETHFQ